MLPTLRMLLGARDVRARKVFAGTKDRQASGDRERIGHAISKIQSGRVASFAESQKTGDGNLVMTLVEVYDLSIHILQQASDQGTGIPSKA